MIGLDILGLAHPKFPSEMVLNNLPYKKNNAIGVFDDPFGNVKPRLLKYLDSGKIGAVRIQLYWDANHTTLIPKKQLRKKCKKWEKVANKYPKVKIYLSHSCEHRSRNRKELEARIKIIRKWAPSCTPVNSPLNEGLDIAGEINEGHGNDTQTPKPYIYSHDGTDAFKQNGKVLLQNNSAAEIRFAWIHSFNLRKYGAPFVPIPKRTVRTTKKEMEQINKMVRSA